MKDLINHCDEMNISGPGNNLRSDQEWIFVGRTWFRLDNVVRETPDNLEVDPSFVLFQQRSHKAVAAILSRISDLVSNQFVRVQGKLSK